MLPLQATTTGSVGVTTHNPQFYTSDRLSQGAGERDSACTDLISPASRTSPSFFLKLLGHSRESLGWE